MVGISVPSRAYNTMAAGRPIIAVMEEGCEVAEMVREHQIGWVVPPGDEFRLAAAIREAERAPERLAEMGRRARLLAETLFSRRSVLQAYVLAIAPPSGGPPAEAVLSGVQPERLA
jgi:glycosyltransferase involved in cell wall biosynthesis